MNSPSDSPMSTSRRSFIKAAGKVAAVSALAGVKLPSVHAAGSDGLRVALVGCGGRGTGAADNALAVTGGSINLVAMADVFDNKLKSSYNSLKSKRANQVDIPDDRKFVGFEAYKKAFDCLKPGDIAIMATPLAFRPIMYKYAIEKGLNVFMEKPLIADGPSAREMFKLNEEAKKKNLKCAVGLMCRHGRERQELFKRIQ